MYISMEMHPPHFYASFAPASGHEYLICMIIFDPLHQVSYSYYDLHYCSLCCTYHLHIMRQTNVIL
jgi:hypothetical protein